MPLNIFVQNLHCRQLVYSISDALESISPTFFAQLFGTKDLREAFCTYILGLYFLTREY
jgi:hypothetical protein